MTELERRAMMGDKAAQAECVWKEHAVPCQCGGKPIVLREQIKREYIVICQKCGMNTGVKGTQTLALDIWNNRPAPPIGRCGECANRHSSEFCECRDDQGFCSDFEPKGDRENGKV